MPRRAEPGDRARLEAALTEPLRDALEEMRELLNVADWQHSPLGPPFQQCAVVLVAARLIASGRSEKDAPELAAIELGIKPDTARARSRKWPRESRRTLSTPTATPAADTLDRATHIPPSENVG